MKTVKIYCNNEMYTLPGSHHALIGDGVFETLRTYRGRPAFLDRHVNRLLNSADVLSIPHRFTRSRITSLVMKTLSRDSCDTDQVLRIFLTSSGDLLITKDPWKGYPDRFYTKGMHLGISRWRRVPGMSFPPGVKSMSYAGFMLIQREAKRNGFDDAIILTEDGYICETSRSNIFLVKDGCIRTPDLKHDVFPGITREIVMSLARKEGFDLLEDHLNIDDLFHASEVFLTSSLLEVAPVTRVNRRKISSGKPGEVFRKLRTRYLEHVNPGVEPGGYPS